jgi:DNA-binding NarL/FixJ family response regulator
MGHGWENLRIVRADIARPPAFTVEQYRELVEPLGLPPQQARIVELILEGRKDKQIAREMGLSFSTVRTYLQRVFARLEVTDRVELVVRVFAVRQSLLDDDAKIDVNRNIDLWPKENHAILALEA